MITQYTESYSSISADIQGIVANRCSPLDKYVLMQTGEREHTALIYDPVKRECTKLRIYRTNNYNTYQVEESASKWEYSYTNEYYTYSNQGHGRALTLPSMEGLQTYGIAFLCAVVAFAIMFKGVLFKCLRKR